MEAIVTKDLKIKTCIMVNSIVGRKEEMEELKRAQHSERPEFIAVYGRRRVGKTFLVKEFFGYSFDFYVTGTANLPMKPQLKLFYKAVLKYNTNPAFVPEIPVDWFDAFELLEKVLEATPKKGKKIIFLDELPWFDTPRSNFVQALEFFWNSYASTKNILLIVCGSSASWMIHRLIRSRGGLHNRLTSKIKMEPFDLAECASFFKLRGAGFENYQITQLYMALGGVPFYLDLIDTTKSATQNIHELCFKNKGKLLDEFSELYSSLFKNPGQHLAIIRALSSKRKGLTRMELLNITKLPDAGSTSKVLKELIESGFVKEYLPFGARKKNGLFQLVDFFSLFHLNFMEDPDNLEKKDWILSLDDPTKRAWSGYAFEMVCMQHIRQIKKAMGIGSVQTNSSSWIGENNSKGCQIDLLIDRRDDVINLCEIKFSNNEFEISKKYAQDILSKAEVFKAATRTKKSIFVTFITPFGLKDNASSKLIVQKSLTLSDLFIQLS